MTVSDNVPHKTLEDLDELTKLGKKSRALDQIKTLLKKGTHRDFLPVLAQIANRNHAPLLALRILHPIIKEDREGLSRASVEALNTYAISLVRIGALEEAEQWLEKIPIGADTNKHLLTQVNIDFARWDYHKSISQLLRYINSIQSDDYQKLVGYVNLVAAMLPTGDVKEARKLLTDLKPQLKEDPRCRVLYGNCLELEAQALLQENYFSEALRTLNDAEQIFTQQAGRYLVYINKWKAVAQLSISPQDEAARSLLASVRQDSLATQNWETVRDCDFHFSRLTDDQNLLNLVLSATPYKGYHERVKQCYRLPLPHSQQVRYCPQDFRITPAKIDVHLEKILDDPSVNYANKILCSLLTRDIYRPPRMGVVFSGLFPDEYFNPFSSPQRVRTSVSRFNQWAARQASDLRLKVKQGDFQFKSLKEIGISFLAGQHPLEPWQARLQAFKNHNGSRSFTAHQLAHFLDITPRSAVSLLRRGLNSKKVEKIGVGKNTRYIFFSGRRKVS